MSLAAAFQKDDGKPDEPGRDSPWSDWVAASSTRNYCNDDLLPDWLALYGEQCGFVPDHKRAGYDPRTDFRAFVFEKAAAFERVVNQFFANAFEVVEIRKERGDVRRRACVEATWAAMCDGARIISQGVLWNPETRTFGAPDLLIRNDILTAAFPECIDDEDAQVSAPDLPLPRVHYRVVDIKFTTLDLQKDGHASSRLLDYMVQVWLYNEALGRLQGFTPAQSFLLGRRWKTSKTRGYSALDRLARIDHDCFLKGPQLELREIARAACAWVRRVRSDGGNWQIFPSPSVVELWPNMRHQSDQPWHQAKAEIARRLEDLTLLPRITPERRSQALAAGICRWTDPRCSAARLGVTGDANPRVLDAVIRANHSDVLGPCVFPEQLTVNERLWREPADVEFYVDFETVSDIDDDFASFPEPGGQPLIFMIGCGQLIETDEGVRWKHRVFTAQALTMNEERRIVEEWIAHMRAVCAEASTSMGEARLFHWSPAETSFLTEAYNSAAVRQNANWPRLPWVDLLNSVIRAQPLTVRGAFGFGLKSIARALHSHGLITTLWADGRTDGLGAMVGAWWCDREAARVRCSMSDLDLMTEIQNYNEVDCRVMAEALRYLRLNR